MKKEHKCFIFAMEPELHKEIKIMAARHNISMALYITRAIAKQLAEDSKYDTKQ